MTTNLPSRRRFLRGAAGTLTVASSLGLGACGSSNDDDPDESQNPAPSASFLHGVASGDPLADRVILWTRVTPEREREVELIWELAEDDAFTRGLKTGTLLTDASRDYTAKIDVTGLAANTVYWYRFKHDVTTSTIGRTRTLPAGAVSQARLAVFSCSNFPAGYFHVYAEAARRDDLHAAIHLGDYIYEYASDGYASDNAAAMGRVSEPANEIVSLTDYRRRYAQYRTDADLQAVHAALPFIVIWDDHEIANNTWREGAENHQPETEGAFDVRKVAAVKAYHEWLPTREQVPVDHLYRRFEFGDLLTLHMLDTRLVARDEQLDYTRYFPALLGNPDAAAGLTDFLTQLGTDLGDTNRQLLGAEQLGWLQQGMMASSATWQVLGQQVLMAPVTLPLPVLLGLLAGAGQLGDVTLPPGFTIDPAAYATLLQRRINGEVLTAPENAILDLPSLPYNLDSWDGYWAARETVLQTARTLDKNLVVLAGDTHNAWASDLRSIAGERVGVEFATSSVSSPGFEEYLGAGYPPAALSALVRQLSNLNTLGAVGSHWAGSLQYSDTSRRGYMVITATHAEVRADWHMVDTVQQEAYTAVLDKSLRVLPGAANRRLLDDIVG
ncbi:Phosphodiesterase/alkaline phosphatase D [plant metagenome]|uniref:Phosphodiesterase/alkaline phosphatase D n=1 Tax=plant metagenome TaxID=1297885 RepID=A0A484P8X8_9ZZZZ